MKSRALAQVKYQTFGAKIDLCSLKNIGKINETQCLITSGSGKRKNELKICDRLAIAHF